MTRTRALPVAVLAALASLATGCSSGSGGGHDAASPDRAAIRSGLATLVARDDPTTADTADGACFAKELLGRTSPDQLRDAGVLDPSYAVVDEVPRLPEGVARAWAASLLECSDFVATSARARAAISHGRVDAEAYAACLRGALTGGELREALVDTLTGDWGGAALARLTGAQGDCAERP